MASRPMEEKMRVRWNKVLPATIAALMLLAACTPAATEAPPAPTKPPAAADTAVPPEVDPMADLVTAAQAEGLLSTIALPHDWCNYGGGVEGFKAKYGLGGNEVKPEARPRGEVEGLQGKKK